MKRRNNKTIIKRMVALTTVFALSLGVVPMPEIVEELQDNIFNNQSIIRAQAVSNPTITTIEELQAYATSYTADNKEDTITIDCADRLLIPYDFPGIGTSDAPFEGTLIIKNVSSDNGGSSRYLQLRAPLFNYISDKATIVDANSVQCTLYLFPASLDSGVTYDKPLFANHVAGIGGTANWKIRVNDLDWNDLDSNNEPKVKINARSSIIGDIYNKTANPNVTIEYYNQSATINGSGNLGTICNTISAGSLTVSLNNGIEAPIISSGGYSKTVDGETSITDGGNVGGLVGEMNTGTTLVINSNINYSNARTISTTGGFAGGLVGYCKGTVSFNSSYTYNDSLCATTITGTTGAGGLFGCLEASSNLSIDLDRYNVTTALASNDLPGSGVKTTASNSNVGGIIGKLVNNGSDSTPVSIQIAGTSIPSDPSINTSLWADQEGSNGGGLIGYYYSYSLKNTLEIKDVNVQSSGIKIKQYNGGLIGIADSENGCGAYIKISDVKSYVDYKVHGVATQHNLNANSSALICYSDKNFIDVSGSIIPVGYAHTALFHNVPSGVIRLSGSTDLSQLTETTGYIASNRGNTLIYALGNGNDANWTYKRHSTAVDDVNPWGQVVRFVSTTAGGTTNTQTLEDAAVITVHPTNHTVTLNAAVKNMSSSADFAKTALNIQLNTTVNNFGALCFTTGSANQSSTLLSDNLTISNNITLVGSGITGFTRDNGTSAEFTGTLRPSGGNYSITLAIGEAYGLKSDGSVAATGTNLTGSNLVSSNANTGAIIAHKYNGLFAKLGNSTIGDDTYSLTVDGCITVCSANVSHYIGGLSAQMTGAAVKVQKTVTAETINLGGAATECVGLLIGDVAANTATTNTLELLSSSMTGTTNVNAKNARIGFVGRVSDPNISVTAYDLTLAGSINYIGGGRPYAGGLIGEASSNNGSDSRTLIIEDVIINNLTVATNISSSTTGINSPAGGILGGQWNNTNVYFGKIIDSDSTVTGLTVTSGTLALNGNANCVGGLVSDATGYWQVNKIGITSMSITNVTNALGVMVLNGALDSNNALYLEITSPTAYTISANVTSNSPTVYDELVAFSKVTSYDSTSSSYIASESNGQGVISYHTTNYSDATKLSMTSGSDNSYQPQTTLGSNHNPYSRYYYNLDYILKNNSYGGEKMLLWSVYNYAASNIQGNTAIGTANTHNFSEYTNLAALVPDGTICDLSYLSYYPVDVNSALSLDGITVILHNSEMQAAHGANYHLNGPGTKSVNSQHFLMHAGLFKDVKANLTLTDITLQGNVSNHASANGITSGSGAIVCGDVYGSSADSRTTLSINDLVLDGIKVNGTVGALILKSVGSNTNMNISGVTTTNKYNTGKTTPIAADYLIGDVSGSAMTISFVGMVLDARDARLMSGGLYNPDASSSSENSKEKTAAALNTAYNTYSSIFNKSTFFNSFNYETGDVSAKYNYAWSEDWGSTKHQVTYAKELSLTTSEYWEEEYKYSDRYDAGNGAVYTSPESDNLTASNYDFSGFLPHVYTAYNSSTNYHEVAVNIVESNLTDGCGTYNDPYKVNGDQLTVVAKVLNGNISNNFYLYIDNDYVTGKNVNFEKWCTDKSGHSKFIYNNGVFEKENAASTTLTIAEVQQYLAGSYYEIDGNISLGGKFLGLGGNTAATAFRGVIVGKAKEGVYPVITNASSNPLIKVSNGSVVKDVTVKVSATAISLTTDNVGTAGALGYDSKTPYYGAVIGEIMGGDNIIDNTGVIFDGDSVTPTLITVGGKGECNIPVGAYVGVLVNGTLVFRSMTAAMTNTTTTKYHVYKSTDTAKTFPLEIDAAIAADGTESFRNLYVNPIVGRVINGVAINETTAYRFSEDGKYVDALSASRSADRAASADQVTLKNGRKNYSIPDINKGWNVDDSAENILNVSSDNTTITIPNAQALFILSAICQMNAGSAETKNAADNENYQSTAESGYDAASANSYKATHLAGYAGVGVITSKSDATYGSDYALTNGEWANDANEVPYLIVRYTNHYTPAKTSVVRYPARRVTDASKAKTKYNITLSATSGTTYYLPDSFRGIGYLGGNTNGKTNYITVKTFNGNNNIIDFNSYFRTYESTVDNYFGAKNSGIALFNHLTSDGHTGSSGVPSSSSNSIKDSTLQGYISAKRASSSNAIVSGTGESSSNIFWRVGGVIACDDGKTFDFENISLNSLNLDGSYHSGGLIGGTTANGTYYINNCNANKLKILGSDSIGGLIGYPASSAIYHNTKTNAFSTYNVYVESVASSTLKTVISGGLIGNHPGGTKWIKNANIVGWCGLFNSDSSVNSLIGRTTDLAKGNIADGNNVTFCSGGAIGRISGGTTIIDNVNVYGMNIYGCAAGGIVGTLNTDNATIRNCGFHGTSDDNVTVSSGTYSVNGYYYSAGILGYSHSTDKSNDGTSSSDTPNSFSSNGATYFRGIYNVHVNNCTIKADRADNFASVGGVLGLYRNRKVINNAKVNNCDFVVNGRYVNRMGGLVGGASRYNLYATNISIINNTFSPTLYSNTSLSSYGLLFGGRLNNGQDTGDHNNSNPVQFFVSGYTSYGNTISVPFSDVIPSDGTSRPVEFDFGRLYTSTDLFRNIVQNPDDVYDRNGGTTAATFKPSYIIYSDYKSSSRTGTSGVLSSVKGSGVNNVPMRSVTKATINETEYSFYGSEVSTETSSVTNDIFPYVIASPVTQIGDKILTGDGIWIQKNGDDFTIMADEIISDREEAVSNGTHDATVYMNFRASDIAAYEQLKDDGKISTFNTEQGSNVLTNDFPVIVVDDASYDYTSAIRSYIRILSNTNYEFDTTTGNESYIYGIEVLRCNYDKTTNTLAVSSSDKTFDINSEGRFNMSNTSYDSSVSGQFSLIDVKFYDPANKKSKVAYHLYIPVYTKKAFNFKFDITAISGTSYYSSDYTTGTHFAGVNSNPSTRGERSNIVVENYSSPVTMYVRYEYSTTDIINDLLGAGYGLNWNYNKALDLIYNYSNDDALPRGTKFILIDANNKDKVNYSTGFSPSANADLDIDSTLFPAYTVDGNDYGAYNVVSFKDLFNKQGITFIATPIADSETAQATIDSGVPVFHAETTDGNNPLQFEASGVPSGKSLVVATSTGDGNDISVGTDLYTIIASSPTLYEDYYLTIIAPADTGDVRHQINFKSKPVLESGDRIKANCEKNDNVILMFANLFTKNISITTVENDNADKEMSTSGQNAIDIRALTTISFNSTGLGNQLNEVRLTLDDRDVEIYDSTQLQFVKIEADNSQQTIAVDGVNFSLNSAPSESSQNYIYNSGVYAKMADGTTGENIFYSSNTETSNRYKQVVSCTNSSTDFSGSRITNFYEIINKNGGSLIDIRPYLTGEYFNDGTPHEIEIVANFKMTYNPNGILEQFALRESGSTAGTIIKGQAALAYQQDGTTYSTNTSDLVDATPLNRKYYRKDASKTTLYYNVVTSNTLSSADAKLKTNAVLGINPLDTGTGTRSAISTWGNYDASQLAGASSATNVKWTLSIYRRQKAIVGGEETGDEYGGALAINDYLKEIKLYGINQSDATKGTEITLTSSTATELTFIAPRASFEDLTLRNDPSDDTEKTNKFVSYVDFKVITGTELESAEQFYSNYKVILTAELVGDTSSKASDHIIYTNARLDPSFVDKTAS